MTPAQTELLAAAKEADEYWNSGKVMCIVPARLGAAIAAVEREAEPETCEWTENDPWGATPGTFDGTCGVCWYLDLTLAPAEEQDIAFCPRCGKPVKFVSWVPEPDEDDEPAPAGSGGAR